MPLINKFSLEISDLIPRLSARVKAPLTVVNLGRLIDFCKLKTRSKATS